MAHTPAEEAVIPTSVPSAIGSSFSPGLARKISRYRAEPPLEMYRGVSHLKICLPVGSSEADYDIQISGPDRKMLFAATGTVIKQRGVMYLAVEIDLSSASPGLYVLQLQKVGSEWTSYPLGVK